MNDMPPQALRRPRWLILLLAGLMAVLGAATFDGNDLERNQELLNRWRSDPEHYARLLRDLRAFYALPPEQQQKLRKLDRDLHATNLNTQTRLWGVLDRYATWFDKLPAADQQRIREAAVGESRLAILREIRQREWVDRLPATVREEVNRLPVAEQAKRIADLREEGRRQVLLWKRGSATPGGPNLRPRTMKELPAEVQDYLETLKPRLTPIERDRLSKAEGTWPDYPATIRDLAELHPRLPPLPSGPITRISELPSEVRKSLLSLEKRKLKGLQRNMLARWPDFALEVTKLLQREKLPVPPLGASRLEEFPPPLQAVIKQQLYPRLYPLQKETLAKLEGRWPDYPIQLIRFARDRGIAIPGMSLPGPPELWEHARLSLPDVPDRLLMQFALHESTPEDRARWQLNTADPMGSREKVKKAWYRKRMTEQAGGPTRRTPR